jgi:hypothetical protein
MRPYFSAGALAAGCCLVLLITGCSSGGPSVPASTGSGAGAQASSGATSGGAAIAVPGVAKLEASDLASGNQVAGQVTAISCQSGGNCTAAGTYGGSGSGSDTSVFVVSEKSGVWSTATTVAGVTTADALSCASAGNCVLGGIASSTGVDTSSAYLAVEADGTWGAAKTIPSQPGQAYTLVPVAVDALSCAAPGDCTVSGQALNATQQNLAHGGGSYAPVVATMTSGVLGRVTELSLPSFRAPGDSNADQGWITSLSCASAGNCTATGFDEQAAPQPQDPPTVSIFAVSEASGTWSTPALLPGSVARDVSNTEPGQLSCASAGNCGYVGYYEGSTGYTHPFVASQASGAWLGATDVKGDPGYAFKSDSEPAAISCPAPGACTAALNLEDASQGVHAFVVSEAGGTWGTATEVKDSSGSVGLIAVSCVSVGDCVAAGSDGVGPVTIAQVNGAWQAPKPVTGIAALQAATRAAGGGTSGGTTSGPSATVDAVSCVPGGYCGIGGDFTIPTNGGTDPFVGNGS